MNAHVLVAKKGHIPFFSDRKAIREQYRLSMAQAYILAVSMIAGLGVYYVWILNVNATSGYNVRKLQLEQRDLSFEENILDIHIAEAESTSTVESNPKVRNMPAVDHSEFLVVKDVQFTFKD